MHDDLIKGDYRVGEADNPGPLRVGTFNPHQILNKEDVIAEWGEGVWAGSETSHTNDAMRISSAKFRQKGLNTVWSPPVPKHTHNAGVLRGRASGTCVVSTLKLKPYPAIPSSLADQSSRLTECLVDLGAGTNLFVASVYGPTHTSATFCDPWTILSNLCTEAFDHALAFKGPAIVAGDFNVTIDELPRWNAMLRNGWVDAAAFDAMRRGVEPGFTCKEKTRKSFLLINQQLVQSLVRCEIMAEWEFDSHPLLMAEFDLQTIIRPRQKWWLPASTDHLFFDDQLMHDQAATVVQERGDKFRRALDRQDSEEAMRQFFTAFDSCLQESCVDAVGNKCKLPKRCLGRGKKATNRRVRPCAPTIKPGRHDHYTPELCQPSLEIRLKTKQVRRLQSLVSQVQASNKRGDQTLPEPCQQLWRCILSAKGFFPSFADFVMQQWGVFVPMCCPHVEYLQYITVVVKSYLQVIVAEVAKAQRFARECKMLQDIQKGGSEAFKSVKDPGSPAFHAIEQVVKVQVVRQRWPKEGRNCLRIQGCCDVFDKQFPVYFQDQECFITAERPQHVVLDRFVKWKTTDDWSLSQMRIIADQDKLQTMTGEAWSTMWMREPEDDSVENWADAIGTLDHIRHFPQLMYQPLEADEWKRNALSVSKKSARGSCGFTCKELASMPNVLLDWLLTLLMAIEKGLLQWPSSLMVARVVMLGKTGDRPKCPLQTRPITIASRIYRNWARYRSLQIISHVQNFLPPAIAGTAAGVSSDMLAAHVLLEVEKALLDGVPRMGITIDLVKCFNQIPRKPVLAAMLKIGIPVEYVTALDSMFLQLRRVLELSGEIGTKLKSTTGVPEGCAMSLVSMISLTVWVAQYIEASVQSSAAQCLAYADNWAIISQTLSDLRTGIQALDNMVRMLRMNISVEKSWTWSTHKQSRQALSTIQLAGRTVPTKLVTEELGCDVSYCKKVSKKVTQKRIAKAVRVLGRVGTKKLPKRFKAQMTNQLSAGISGYGSALVYHTVSDLRVLRTAMCRSLGRSRAGNSPYMSTLMTEGVEDIALTLLLRKVFFWRRFMRVFKDWRQNFLDAMAFGRHKHGATAFFRRTFEDHGWSCRTDGRVVHDRGWKFNWLTDSKSHIRNLLRLSWSFLVCKHVQERKSFDIDCLDVPAFFRATGKEDCTKKANALNLACGKHVTNDALVHYSKGAKTNACPFCGLKDGRLHRIWHCEKTQHIRDGNVELFTWLADQPDAVSVWGVLPIDLEWIDWSFAAEPIGQVVGLVHAETTCIDFFTDGSALGQGIVGHTIAAAAYVGCKEYAILKTCSEPLPGSNHSSYRAEIWGIIMVLRDVRRAHIYTDCAAVFSNLQACLTAQRVGSRPKFHDHEDLWDQVWLAVSLRGVGDVRVTKVKAHRDISTIAEPVERWKAVMNDKADRLAKTCLYKTWKNIVKDLQTSLLARDRNISMLKKFHTMWHDMNTEALKLCAKEGPVHASAPAYAPRHVPENLVKVSCVVPPDAISKCRFHPKFAERVVRYFHELEWDYTQPSVSCLELYVDFVHWTGTMAPCLVYAGKKGPRGKMRTYELPDLCPIADVAQETMRQQSRTWTKMLSWLREHADHAPPKPSKDCSSLVKMGYSQQHFGVPGCPKFRSGRMVFDSLWQFFHTECGSNPNMDRRWKICRSHLGGG